MTFNSKLLEQSVKAHERVEEIRISLDIAFPEDEFECDEQGVRR